ncbi:hypothetical protein SCUCBS95973_007134 [Sporothrix curviconia]|uniref:Uncharacterized protein n=1 Tax=Sporothrix curviconia TaxID=1260050 RepID=A0ABP0CC15_9PEZI
MLSAFGHATDDNFLGRQTLPNNRTLDHYRGLTIVRDPNVNIANEEERLALLVELRAQAVYPPTPLPVLNLDSVNERLQNLPNDPTERRLSHPPSEATTITPTAPLEGEALAQFHRDEEKRYRAKLIETGCPPCQPLDRYIFPYDTEDRLPREHPVAMYYIISERNGHGFMPLADQLRDWLEFLDFQQSLRRNWQTDTEQTPDAKLEQYIDDGRWLLNKCKFYESASLIDWSIDLSNQSRLQTWLEFQARRARHHWAMKNTARHNIQGAHDEADRQWHQNYEARRMAAHEAMLAWMEEHRVALSAAEQAQAHTLRTKRSKLHGGNYYTLDNDAAGNSIAASAVASRRQSSRILSRTNAAQHTAASKRTASRGKARVAKHSAPRTRKTDTTIPKQKPQKARPMQPVFTRSGRQIRKPDRLGWT